MSYRLFEKVETTVLPTLSEAGDGENESDGISSSVQKRRNLAASRLNIKKEISKCEHLMEQNL